MIKWFVKKVIAYDRLYPILRTSFLYIWRKKLSGQWANLIYNNPSKDFFVIGVTGTNGKTTTVNLLHHMLNVLVGKTAMISTAQIKIGNKTMPNTQKMSSLDVWDLMATLALAREQGCKIAVLEVTSIGLEQFRFDGVSFDVWVLTNITEDHLDYHWTMENYARAKKKLFDYVLRNKKSQKFAVFPRDDLYGRKWAEDMPFDKKITYGLYGSSVLQAEQLSEKIDGTSFRVSYLGKEYAVDSPLVGAYNVSNVLAAMAVLVEMWFTLPKIIQTIPSFPGVPGRMESFMHNDVRYFVDFAHSPDALEKTLTYLQQIKWSGRLFVVFGAPWNRDKGKRPKMWAIVDRMADVLIATDDDPDTENRLDILAQLVKNVQRTQDFFVIPAREKAIAFAVDNAGPGDIVLLAGKWHETVQRTNFGHRPWSDKEELLSLFADW